MAQRDQSNAPIRFDRHVDLLVAGAGAGGMSAALAASIEGVGRIDMRKVAAGGRNGVHCGRHVVDSG